MLEFCRLQLIRDLLPEFYKLAVVMVWDEGLFGYKQGRIQEFNLG